MRVGRKTGSERCTVVERLHAGSLLPRFMSVASGAGVFGRKLESGEVMRAGCPVDIDSFIRMGRAKMALLPCLTMKPALLLLQQERYCGEKEWGEGGLKERITAHGLRLSFSVL